MSTATTEPVILKTWSSHVEPQAVVLHGNLSFYLSLLSRSNLKPRGHASVVGHVTFSSAPLLINPSCSPLELLPPFLDLSYVHIIIFRPSIATVLRQVFNLFASVELEGFKISGCTLMLLY